jgi:hypothetical protein
VSAWRACEECGWAREATALSARWRAWTCGIEDVWVRVGSCVCDLREDDPGLRPHPARVASPAHASHPHLPSPPCLVMQIFIKGAGKTFTLNVMPSDTTEILKQKAS